MLRTSSKKFCFYHFYHSCHTHQSVLTRKNLSRFGTLSCAECLLLIWRFSKNYCIYYCVLVQSLVFSKQSFWRDFRDWKTRLGKIDLMTIECTSTNCCKVVKLMINPIPVKLLWFRAKNHATNKGKTAGRYQFITQLTEFPYYCCFLPRSTLPKFLQRSLPQWLIHTYCV